MPGRGNQSALIEAAKEQETEEQVKTAASRGITSHRAQGDIVGGEGRIAPLVVQNLTFGLLSREGGAEGHRLLLHGIGTRVLGGLEDALAAHRINHRNRAAINNNVGITTASHVCRSRASTRGNIVELTVRQLYLTFSIRYADGCQKRRGGRQTNNVLRIALFSIIER